MFNSILQNKELIMVWYGKILVLVPSVATAGVLATSDEIPIQITALAILAISVGCLWKYLNHITESHKKERAELVNSLRHNQVQIITLYKQTLSVVAELIETLKDRTCLMRDHRIMNLLNKLKSVQDDSDGLIQSEERNVQDEKL